MNANTTSVSQSVLSDQDLVEQWLRDLYDLCDFLDLRPGHHAYQASLPERFHYLLGESVSGLVVYHNGWGWRLRKDWKTVWDYLANEYVLLDVVHHRD